MRIHVTCEAHRPKPSLMAGVRPAAVFAPGTLAGPKIVARRRKVAVAPGLVQQRWMRMLRRPPLPNRGGDVSGQRLRSDTYRAPVPTQRHRCGGLGARVRRAGYSCCVGQHLRHAGRGLLAAQVIY